MDRLYSSEKSVPCDSPMSWIPRLADGWLLRNSHLTAANDDTTWVFFFYASVGSFGVNNPGYFQVRGQGDAYYPSQLEPCAVSLGNGRPSWDPLEVAVREAHARGIELHAWINAFTGWASPNPYSASYCALLKESAPGQPRHMLLAHPEWYMVSSANVVFTCANSQAYEYAYV